MGVVERRVPGGMRCVHSRRPVSAPRPTTTPPWLSLQLAITTVPSRARRGEVRVKAVDCAPPPPPPPLLPLLLLLHPHSPGLVKFQAVPVARAAAVSGTLPASACAPTRLTAEKPPLRPIKAKSAPPKARDALAGASATPPRTPAPRLGVHHSKTPLAASTTASPPPPPPPPPAPPPRPRAPPPRGGVGSGHVCFASVARRCYRARARATQRRRPAPTHMPGLTKRCSGAKVVTPAHSRGPATFEGMASGMGNVKASFTVMDVA